MNCKRRQPVRAVARPRLESLEDRSVPSVWSTPVNLGDVVNGKFLDQRCTISKDGLSLYFGSNRPGSVGTTEGSDLYVTQRTSVDASWGPPQKVEALCSTGDDNAPTFSPDGHWVYFGSDRDGGSGGMDLWAAHRQDKNDDFGWETPVNLGPTINSLQNDDGPTYFEDENGAVTLYFTSFQRPEGLGDWDIYASHATADGHLSFGPAVNVSELNSPRRDTRTTISRDGLEFFLTSTRVGSVPDATDTPSLDIWVSTRASTADPWGTPVNVGAPINTPANDGAPSLSFDGLTLYFDSTRSEGFGMRDLYVTTRTKENGNDNGVLSAMLVCRKAGKNQTDYLALDAANIGGSGAPGRTNADLAPNRLATMVPTPETSAIDPSGGVMSAQRTEPESGNLDRVDSNALDLVFSAEVWL
jgi:WD40-like Beta Propeller Repeat